MEVSEDMPEETPKFLTLCLICGNPNGEGVREKSEMNFKLPCIKVEATPHTDMWIRQEWGCHKYVMDDFPVQPRLMGNHNQD